MIGLSNHTPASVSMVYTILDQVFWQAMLNSDTETGGFNLIAGGLLWFPLPAVFGLASGMGYLTMNMAYGQVQLSPSIETLG